MVSNPPVKPTGAPPQGDGSLDRRREESMADEGGWSAALIETEVPTGPAPEPPPPREPVAEKQPPPRGAGPRRLWSAVALGVAQAIAKLTSSARRYAGRRAHARSHGH